MVIVKILADDRERAVIPLFTHGIPLETRRLHVGDYAVWVEGYIVAVIERKTLADFAASLKDGRYGNVSKMIELRERYGVRQLFFIEGKPPRDPSQHAPGSRIPYSVIESACDHLAVRDGIPTIVTRDSEDFAQRLSRFARNMGTLYVSGDVRGGDATEVLGLAPTHTDDDIVTAMWTVFRGIGATNASSLGRDFSVGDVVRGAIPISRLDELPTKIRKSLTHISPNIASALLQAVPGISSGIANSLLGERTLRQLLSYPVGAISIITVGKSKRKLGEPIAAKIVKYFGLRLKAMSVPKPVPEISTSQVTPEITVTSEDTATMNRFLSSLLN